MNNTSFLNRIYSSPLLEVQDIVVEKGFATSSTDEKTDNFETWPGSW